MQRYLTEYRLLPVKPVLFMLLLMALAQQQHRHFEFDCDGKNSLHFIPATFYPDLALHDALACFTPEVLLFSAAHPWTRNSDRPHAPVTALITDPPQSRAPPAPPPS